MDDSSVTPPAVSMAGQTSPQQQQAVQQAVAAPPDQAPQPEHRSFLSNVLGALSSVFGGPKTHSQPDAQGNVVQAPNSTGQRVAGGIGNALAIAGSTLSGHNYVGDIQKEQQQQEQNAESQAKLTQDQILGKASIAHQNNQMLLAQRNEDRMDATQKAQITDSNRAFDLTIADKGFSKPPILVNGKDINGSAGNEADMMQYFSGPGSHKAPDGYSYLYVPSTDEKGNVSHTVYLAPVNQMTQPITISKASFKQQTGLEAPGAGDTVTTTLGGLTSLRSQFVESHLKQAQTKQAEAAAVKNDAQAGLADAKTTQAETSGGTPTKLQGALMSGTDANGNQIAGTVDEMKAAGVKNPVKMGQGEADKVNVARQLTSPTGLFAMAKQNISQFKPEELTALNGRWNEFMTGTVGSGDPRYVKLRTDLALLSTALMQAHVGSKGGEAFMEHFANLANAGKMDGKTLTAALDEEQQYVGEKAMRAKTPAAASGNSGSFDFSKFQAVKQ